MARAQKKKLLAITPHNLRDFSSNKHKKVDDKPFGGGLGMVMQIEPIYKAVLFVKSKGQMSNAKTKTILFTPRGRKFTQKMAYELSKFDQLIFICGRYEGVDERVAQHIADSKVSIGNYVTMGGEIAALAIIETVARLIPGVIGKQNFLRERDKKKKGFVEYPQYTRPEIFNGWKAPKILLSGNHKKIGEWREKHGKIIGKSEKI